MADMFTLCSVRDVALVYVTENFDRLLDSDQFYKLSADHLAIIMESDRLRISSELQLFHVVSKVTARVWIKYSTPTR